MLDLHPGRIAHTAPLENKVIQRGHPVTIPAHAQEPMSYPADADPSVGVIGAAGGDMRASAHLERLHL